MKVKLCDTNVYLEIEDITNLTSAETQNIESYREERKLKCAGCDKELNKEWIATIHCPKSAYHGKTNKSSMDWTLWLLHLNTKTECADKWLKKRKN